MYRGVCTGSLSPLISQLNAQGYSRNTQCYRVHAEENKQHQRCTPRIFSARQHQACCGNSGEETLPPGNFCGGFHIEAGWTCRRWHEQHRWMNVLRSALFCPVQFHTVWKTHLALLHVLRWPAVIALEFVCFFAFCVLRITSQSNCLQCDALLYPVTKVWASVRLLSSAMVVIDAHVDCSTYIHPTFSKSCWKL